MATEQLIQNTIEIIDTAHDYGLQLSQLLETLTQLEDQVRNSSTQARQVLTTYFTQLKIAVCETLDTRLKSLLTEVQHVHDTALKPLQECRAVINKSVESASIVMDEGGRILAENPENNLENIMKFRDNPLTKGLASFPELPSPSEVAFITAEMTPNLKEQLISLILHEGKITSCAPVQILSAEEKPGGIQVFWNEVEEESDISEFMLQYACGKTEGDNNSRLLFHTVYEGPSTSFTVKNLRQQTPYTFRVRGRSDKTTQWSAWSVPHVVSTNIPHHQWSPGGEVYSLSNEGRTATRMREGLTRVLYSNNSSYSAGDALIMRVLDSADVSPGDGLAIVLDNKDENSCNRLGAVFVDTYGAVYVDGQEMKIRLPSIKKGTSVTFQTESLPNGKVRVSVQVDDKEVTLDWKRARSSSEEEEDEISDNDQSFFFALRFAQEHWKIGVE